MLLLGVTGSRDGCVGVIAALTKHAQGPKPHTKYRTPDQGFWAVTLAAAWSTYKMDAYIYQTCSKLEKIGKNSQT